MTAVDPSRVRHLLTRERTAYRDRHPASHAAWVEGQRHLLGGVPMTWMLKAAGGFPVFLAGAHGARIRDIDGHEYVDFSLGDTGAMAGHSPEPVVEAVRRRMESLGGATAMLPTEDAAWVAGDLTRRFGVGRWSFTLTATDANRWAIRLARQLTRRPKILVFAYCYHGSVDEAFALAGADGKVVARDGNVGAPVDLALTTRVVEFNDAQALRRELAHGDVACVLMAPALPNIGKAIGGGVPIGAYGLTDELADRVLGDRSADIVDTGGVGGTLAGNALSLAAARATLEHVLTEAAFERMSQLAERFTAGVQDAISRHGVGWSVSRLGARTEYRFTSPAPRSGTESAAAESPELDDLLHVYAANRGILLTPFHNMALMCPATTTADVDLHTEVFGAALAELVG